MKKAIYAALLALMTTSSFSLASCGANKGTYTITFNSQGGSAVEPIIAKAGSEITAPVEPTKNGFEFLGWFESNDGGTTLAANEFVITIMPAKNLTLYAKWNEFSEVGRKYSVKDSATDINFVWEDPTKIPENADEFKASYSTINLTFKENHGLEIYLGPGLKKDITHFYSINSENYIEFFNSVEDAQNGTNKVTEDYFAFEYKFSSDRKSLIVTIAFDEKGAPEKAIIKLTPSF